MADFNIAVQITLDPAHEGGFQKNAKDRANWTGGQVGVGTLVGTKYGVTTLDMPGVDIENLTPAQAAQYYRENYWKPLYSQIRSQLIANKLFDLGVLFGVGHAVKGLQEALGIQVDGNFGPISLVATDAGTTTEEDERDLLAEFKNEMHARARAIAAANPNDAPDLPDWDRRIDS